MDDIEEDGEIDQRDRHQEYDEEIQREIKHQDSLYPQIFEAFLEMMERKVAAFAHCVVESFPFQGHDISGVDLEAVDDRHGDESENEHENRETSMQTSGNRYLQERYPIDRRRQDQ